MKQVYRVIGIMSGTSLDGVDLVYTEIESNLSYKYKIIAGVTYEYSKEWLLLLKGAFSKSKEDLIDLNIQYGKYIGELVLKFKKEFAVDKVDFIASHGHTIFHRPEENYTLQIGCGNEVARIAKTKVVNDFRSQDVALGGQGAPLVPIGDRLLFSEFDYCLNLGGFANISYEEMEERKAYDICPVNIVLNYFTNQIGKSYDDKGKLASSGEINSELLEKLNSDPFYKLSFPKSLGFEFVVSNVLPEIEKFQLEIKDILRTFIEHVAIQISSEVKPAEEKAKELKMLVTGGGVYNEFLMGRIKSLSNIDVKIPEKELVEFKEALIFAFLGVLRVEEKVNCLKSVTGAIKDHSGGTVINYKGTQS